jgi:hypothetical protein
MRIFLTILFSSFVFFSSYAQEFGGNPPSTRWKQINTDTFRLIFPKGLDSVAERIAIVANALNRYTKYTIGDRQKKINILLQNATTISNGYVALGPFRSEFELLPQQNSFELGSLPWPDNLVIHEWRHVQQYSNFNKGISKAFFILFGQEGQALANALSVPDWFFEGDAVYQETLVSEQGRGRLPFFFNGYRSLWQEGRNYSWMKLRNGSLRDYVPDHYRLGYMLVAYGRERYGEEFWKTVTNEASAFKGLFYPLQNGIKKATGQTYSSFRDAAFSFFKERSVPDRTPDSVSHFPPKQRHFFADEEYPYWLDDGSVVYMRSSYDRTPRFVIRRDDADHKLRVRDISIDQYFSYRNGKIVYAAYQPHIRWGRIDYSDLKMLDVKTGKQKSLTHHTKYFAPDISVDGSRIVAVHVDALGRSSLHLLDTNGRLNSSIRNPGQLFYTYPKFLGENKILSAVRNRKGQMSLAIIDIHTGTNQFLLPFTYDVIGFPWEDNGTIYFSASSNGHDRLFEWKDGKVSSLNSTDSRATGEYQLNVRNQKAVWNRFTSAGYQLQFGNITNLKGSGKIWDTASDFNVTSLRKPENELLNRVGDSSFPGGRYSQSFHLLNFHSRRPYINDPEYSFSFVSENILNTLQAEAFVTYNRNEGSTQFGLSAIYGQLFPELNVSSDYTINRNALPFNRTHRAYWNEWETSIGFSVPLNLTHGRSFTSLSMGSDLVFNKRYFQGYYKDTFENRAFAYLNNNVLFTNQVQQARKQIYPRLAQTILLNYKGAVTNLEARQFLASGSFYLPGLFVTHSLVVQAAFQGRDSMRNVITIENEWGERIYSNSFPFSRGYGGESFYRMWKLGANYHLPLMYPDWGFGNIVYFLRLRANVFYDFTRIHDFDDTNILVWRDFRSLGCEFYFDTKWWNQLPLTIGIRYSHLFDPDVDGRSPNQWELVLPVNLLSQ